MPRTKFDKDPPVDILLAVMLERKQKLGMTYESLAYKIGVSPVWLRTLFTTKHTNDWSPDIRRSVCRILHINIQTTLQMAEENQAEIRLG